MTLFWLVLILMAGGVVAWMLERRGHVWTRAVSLAAIGIDLAIALRYFSLASPSSGRWLAEIDRPWIPQLGIRLHLALDGLSLLLILLTFVLGLLAVLSSWTEVRERVGFFHFNLLWVLAGVTGVFLALDLFLFYFFWEMMLVPMVLLIGIWGHENRTYAAMKFFLFTQASGLLMLISILALAILHRQATGRLSFDYSDLLGLSAGSSLSFWLMLGFFAAFAVKLPVVPVHTWLPDAHTEAPTAGSVILAGLLLKTGAYGLIRFTVPLFPEAASDFAPFAMALGVAGILYGALLAFAQTDLKRLVAYSSVSHLGFVLLGVFAWNDLALQGSILQMICHGLSAAALFILVGALQERTHTRDLRRLGGLWSVAPRMSALGLFFAMAALGLPGLGNFVAEFLTLVGSYRSSPLAASLAALGLIAATMYSLRTVQQAFHGPNREGWGFRDLSFRDTLVLGSLLLGLVWLGVYPQPVLDAAQPVIDQLQNVVSENAVAGR